MNTWFVSDVHWGHENILKKFCPNTRQGNNVDEMNEIIIQNWNSVVKPDDVVYNLGDVFFCQLDKALSIMDRLNGKQHLIYGNHDKLIKKNLSLQKKFASIQDYLEIVLDKIPIILFHFPLVEWNKMHYGSYALYGHVHGQLDNDPISRYRTMDVGVDARPNGMEHTEHMMRPWSFEEVHEILSKRDIKGHHS